MHSFTDVQTLLGKPPAMVTHESDNYMGKIVWDPLEHACLLEAAIAKAFKVAISECSDASGSQTPHADDVKHIDSSVQADRPPNARQCDTRWGLP